MKQLLAQYLSTIGWGHQDVYKRYTSKDNRFHFKRLWASQLRSTMLFDSSGSPSFKDTRLPSTTMTDSTDTVDMSRHRIERLSPKNYYLWSKKLELVLQGKGLWGIVSGEELPPPEERPEDLKKFQRRKDTALSDVLLSIEDASSAAVIHLRNPKNVWDELKKTYQAVSEAAVDSLLVQYQAMKMRSRENVSKYVNRLIQLENKLAAIGKTIAKDEKSVTCCVV